MTVDLGVWLEYLAELTGDDVDSAALAQAALDLRTVEAPDEVWDAIDRVFSSDNTRYAFNQFESPESFLLQSGLPLSQVVAAAHPATPESALRALADTENAYIAWALATNPSLPTDLLMGLYESNLTIPEEIEGDETLYERWSWPGYEDPDGHSEFSDLPVRIAVASNPNVPSALLDQIITTGEDLELIALANRLLRRPQPGLSDRQWQDLYGRAVSSYSGGSTWGRLLAIGPTWPIDMCVRLMNCKNDDLAGFVRGVVGCNSACPESIVRELAASEDLRSRWAAASNRSSPQDVLLALAVNDNDVVREAVCNNPSASDEVKAAASLA
jgi:hypothetical protein